MLPVLWLLAYLPAALRRVHGGGRWTNAAKAMVLAGVHLLVVAGLVAGSQVIAILRH